MRPRLWLLLGLIAAGISWSYVHRILGPWTDYIRLKKGLIKVQISDLYSPWVGTRELLLHHRNPYGTEVSHEIQAVYYGHAIDQTYTKPGVEIVDEQRFAYPIYEMFLTAPLVYTDFRNVQRWAPLALGFLVALTVFFCLGILHWRPRWEVIVAMILFTLSSPQIVQGLRLEQLAIVEVFLLVLAAWCVGRNNLASAGALLALFTIKPQMAILPLCWFAIWAAGDWSKRWRLAASFGATLAGLIAAGELLLPGWIGYFLAGLSAYRRYSLPTSFLRIALGDLPGEVVGGLVVVVILAYAWRNRKTMGHSRHFVFILAIFLMGTMLSFPLFRLFNQILLILPAVLLLQEWNALPRLPRLVFIVTVSWPWIISLVLLVFPPQLNSPSQLPLLPSFMVTFMPFLLPLLLATRPSKTGAGEQTRRFAPAAGLHTKN
jgi:hypothetical protein